MKKYITLYLKGLSMGAADVVPGVSGGTIAFITGTYEELINSINNISLSVFKTFKTKGIKTAWESINGTFLLAIFLGIATSILSLSKIIKWLLVAHPILLWSFFFGLVLASILIIAKQIQHWNYSIIIAIIATSILSYLVTISEPLSSPDSLWYIFFCGFTAIIAMILPGVSGAFILLILGAYQKVIDTISNLIQSIGSTDIALIKDSLTTFFIFGLGAILGLKLFSKVLNWMFTHKKQMTLAILTGFMIGSLNKIWPWKKTLTWRINSHNEKVPFLQKSISPFSFDGNNQIALAIVLICIGFFIVFMLEKFGQKKH